MAVAACGYRREMPSVRTRVAFAGGKYLITHPRGRITRLVVRLVVRKVSRKLVTVTHAGAIPATRGSRLATVVGVIVVAGGIVYVVRRTNGSSHAESAVTVPPPHAPFPAASPVAAPPESRDAPSSTPVTSPAAEAAASGVGEGDDALVARVEAGLFGGTAPLGVSVSSTAGVVTLRGQVADEEAEVRFVRDAEAIDGVKAVQSELETVGSEPGSPPS